jgi:hypothetical protein
MLAVHCGTWRDLAVRYAESLEDSADHADENSELLAVRGAASYANRC